MDSSVLAEPVQLDRAPMPPAAEAATRPAPAATAPDDADHGIPTPGEHLLDMWVGASTQIFTGTLMLSRHAAELGTSLNMIALTGVLRYAVALHVPRWP